MTDQPDRVCLHWDASDPANASDIWTDAEHEFHEGTRPLCVNTNTEMFRLELEVTWGDSPMEFIIRECTLKHLIGKKVHGDAFMSHQNNDDYFCDYSADGKMGGDIVYELHGLKFWCESRLLDEWEEEE